MPKVKKTKKVVIKEAYYKNYKLWSNNKVLSIRTNRYVKIYKNKFGYYFRERFLKNDKWNSKAIYIKDVFRETYPEDYKHEKRLFRLFHGYRVYPSGVVVNHRTGRKLKPIICKGRQRVSIRIGKTRKKFLIYRLVAQTYLSNWNPKLEVNHIDGNRNNNHVRNLEMTTRDENLKHFIKLNIRGSHKYVVDNTGRVFDSLVEAAKHFGVSTSAIYRAAVKYSDRKVKRRRDSHRYFEMKFIEDWDGKPWINNWTPKTLKIKDNKGNRFENYEEALKFHNITRADIEYGFKTGFEAYKFVKKDLKFYPLELHEMVPERFIEHVKLSEDWFKNFKKIKNKTILPVVDNKGNLYKSTTEAAKKYKMVPTVVLTYCKTPERKRMRNVDFKFYKDWDKKPWEVRVFDHKEHWKEKVSHKIYMEKGKAGFKSIHKKEVK